jgi:hypothetical protein
VAPLTEFRGYNITRRILGTLLERSVYKLNIIKSMFIYLRKRDTSKNIMSMRKSEKGVEQKLLLTIITRSIYT